MRIALLFKRPLVVKALSKQSSVPAILSARLEVAAGVGAGRAAVGPPQVTPASGFGPVPAIY